MKRGFYLRLAIDGMKKNHRLYIPYLLTCTGMVMMFYIISGLANTPAILKMRGGDTIMIVLTLGSIVIGVFSALFLFYTNSFLIRRRNKEFGLYNILGMNKNNISRIMVIETLLTAWISLVFGLTLGILFSKLAELILVRMLEETAGYSLWIEPRGIFSTLIVFAVIFGLMLLVSIGRIRLTKPLDLLRSEAHGEKPPKANFLFAIAGLALLIAAYYIAVTIETPLAAIGSFFIAVLMVIVGTYLLFIAGSVVLCRLLQKNKKYYYKPAHFVSVSSMAFRMKRNGAGLASICILATMVLVMLSSTSCLYFGGENAIRATTPYDMILRVWCSDISECTDESLKDLTERACETLNGHVKDITDYSVFKIDGSFADGVIDLNGPGYDIETILSSMAAMNTVRTVHIISLSDYNRAKGKEETLSENEVLIWSSAKPYPYKTIEIDGCETIKDVRSIKEFPIKIPENESIVPLYVIVVPDWDKYVKEIKDHIEEINAGAEAHLISGTFNQYCCLNLSGLSDSEQIALCDTLAKNCSAYVSSQSEGRAEFFDMSGSLFFLGIILSIVFIAAAALIIYYKQLSEGYEDQSRFSIMQKVGMTGTEIKNTINSQILVVFFAPLLFAGIHLAFAFPYINKMLKIFAIDNLPLLIVTNLICFVLFSVFYIFVYRKTAGAYYNIVSDMDIKR